MTVDLILLEYDQELDSNHVHTPADVYPVCPTMPLGDFESNDQFESDVQVRIEKTGS